MLRELYVQASLCSSSTMNALPGLSSLAHLSACSCACGSASKQMNTRSKVSSSSRLFLKSRSALACPLFKLRACTMLLPRLLISLAAGWIELAIWNAAMASASPSVTISVLELVPSALLSVCVPNSVQFLKSPLVENILPARLVFSAALIPSGL